MSFTPEDEHGPVEASPLRRVVHWCNVVIRLTERNADQYLSGDLTARFALYHAMGLVADAARVISKRDTEAMLSVNWTALFSMRTFLVHRPHLVDSDKVWQAATESVPALLAAVIAYQTRIS
jgi:uncharacterized protein with HEPN domain